MRLAAAAALIAGVVSLGAQPVAAAAGRPPAAARTPAPARTPAAAPASAVLLVIGPALRRHLLGLYAAFRHLPVTSIAPAAAGQALGAQLRPTGTDWAMVHWQPSARAGRQAAAGFQDGGGTGVFTRSPGGAWTLAGLGGLPAGCAVRIPGVVRRLWHLPGCLALEGRACLGCAARHRPAWPRPW